MKVNAKSWHFQFQWQTYEFFENHIGVDDYSMWDPTLRTNLCSYLRGILWTSIIWSFLVATAPIWLAAWGALSLFWGGINRFTEWWEKRPPPKVVIKPKPKPSSGPSLRSLAWKYAKAKKQKMCPLVEFENPPVFRCPFDFWGERFYSKEVFERHMQKDHPDYTPA